MHSLSTHTIFWQPLSTQTGYVANTIVSLDRMVCLMLSLRTYTTFRFMMEPHRLRRDIQPHGICFGGFDLLRPCFSNTAIKTHRETYLRSVSDSWGGQYVPMSFQHGDINTEFQVREASENRSKDK